MEKSTQENQENNQESLSFTQTLQYYNVFL